MTFDRVDIQILARRIEQYSRDMAALDVVLACLLAAARVTCPAGSLRPGEPARRLSREELAKLAERAASWCEVAARRGRPRKPLGDSGELAAELSKRRPTKKRAPIRTDSD